jgi:hypothetical protein
MESSFIEKHVEGVELAPIWGGYEGCLAEKALEEKYAKKTVQKNS